MNHTPNVEVLMKCRVDVEFVHLNVCKISYKGVPITALPLNKFFVCDLTRRGQKTVVHLNT